MEAPKDGAARSIDRSRDRDAPQRPVTTHSPQRSPAARNEKLASGAGDSPMRGPASGARAGSGDEIIATRGDVKGGMGGLSGSRRRMERFAPISGLSGHGKLESPIVAISQAANGRLMNDRTKLQRPATSAASGDGAFSRDDRPSGIVVLKLLASACQPAAAALCFRGAPGPPFPHKRENFPPDPLSDCAMCAKCQQQAGHEMFPPTQYHHQSKATWRPCRLRPGTFSTRQSQLHLSTCMVNLPATRSTGCPLCREQA